MSQENVTMRHFRNHSYKGNTTVEFAIKSCYRKPEMSSATQLYKELLENVTNVTKKCHKCDIF